MQNSSSFTPNFSSINYSSFGMVMPGRSFTSESYRFGFNGMEKDGEEWTGTEGSHLDFGARIYDSRLGRWLSTDPLKAKFPFWSPYNFAGNNPILYIDPDGEEVELSNQDAVRLLFQFYRAIQNYEEDFAEDQFYLFSHPEISEFSYTHSPTRITGFPERTGNGATYDNRYGADMRITLTNDKVIIVHVQFIKGVNSAYDYVYYVDPEGEKGGTVSGDHPFQIVLRGKDGTDAQEGRPVGIITFKTQEDFDEFNKVLDTFYDEARVKAADEFLKENEDSPYSKYVEADREYHKEDNPEVKIRSIEKVQDED